MIWVQDGLITILTTLIIRFRNIDFANLERHTYKRDAADKPEPESGEILYLYSRQVLPSVGLQRDRRSNH